MAPKAAADKPVKKSTSFLPPSTSCIYPFCSAKSAGGGKKLSPYNKFMKTELARLKETEPNMAHMDRYEMISFDLKLDLVINHFNRFRLAAGNWKHAKK
jgi:hypothetical protein